MKEWRVLMDYIDYYVYSYDEEKIIIQDGEKKNKAQFVYEQITKTYGISEKKNNIWAFDIALDCLRNLDDKDRTYIGENPEYHLYHFSYSMYVRNQYIHCAKKHMVFMADHISGEVMGYIFTVLHPFFNCTNPNFNKLWGDYLYSDLKEHYAAEHPIVLETAQRLSSPYVTETADEAIKGLCAALREELGIDYMKEEIKNIVVEYYESPTFTRGENIEFLNALYRVTRAFPRQYNQIKALQAVGLFSELKSEYGKIKSKGSLEEYLIEEIGFQGEDSELLTECLWYAFEEAKKKEKK